MPEIDVTGGAGGIEAHYEDILTMAGLFDDTGDTLRGWAWADKGIAANGDLLESSVLSPLTFGRAEEAVLSVTVGPRGVLFEAAGVEITAHAMQAQVVIMRGVDELQRQAYEMRDYLMGRVIGFALPGALLVGGGALVVGAGALAITNPATAALVYLNRKELGAAAQRELIDFLQENPDAVQHLINGGGGLVDGLFDNVPPGLRELLKIHLGLDPIHPTTNSIAADLAGLLEDTGFKIDDAQADYTLNAPTSVQQMIENLNLTASDGEGRIDIVKIGEGENARYIVNIPGTDSFGVGGTQVRDSLANLQLVGGQSTAYGDGITAAMERAGIPPGAPVALVGHSQGGMTAVNLASNPEFTTRFNVEHVITAGSPTAQVPHVPNNIQVLSLENKGDVVPLTDGEHNPDQPNRTTVRFDDPQNSIAGNHSLTSYATGAAQVDASDNTSLTETVQQLRNDGFLGNGTTSTTSYAISRDVG